MKEIIEAGWKGNAEVVFDAYNERCRVDDYAGNLSFLYAGIVEECRKRNVKKLIWKVKSSDCFRALGTGMQPEGAAGSFFRGEPCWFFSKFFSETRRKTDGWLKEDRLLEEVLQKDPKKIIPLPNQGIREAVLEDAEELASFYGAIFDVYPVPITDPDYVKKAMNSSSYFMVAEDEGKIVSAASAEVDENHLNAEITDCGTLPAYRKQGHLQHLIGALEQKLVQKGIYSSYSLSRAKSFGMNRSLYQCGYTYGGRLANNCYIYSSIENMNIWWKDLSKEKEAVHRQL
ncbi:putative beta-lysine N-acetyltransferase [Bacillus sp. FJAT-42376]|uniref:putative beta-lysine N-acetyltransferase n=1 Tax=Bacillus sp. FJAT-42376 TaxID=2014076 RepID=UPI000F4DC900|nr:putative beta-lysine N-acetyltransferase [Bacillus sp. FJAT-42376]AZB43214.1 putative beta-lysine N-acetyltransferase [Bacillus sp. FJAT-42376]